MIINLRNALMTGKRLPYDAEVEYLESTGTQFIDTGVIPTTDLEFELHVKFSALLTTTGQVPMGFRYVQGLQWRYMVSNYPYLGTSTTYSYASFFNNQRCYAAKVGTLEYVFSLKNGVFSNGIGNNTQVSMSGTPPITPIPDNWTIYLFKGNQINEGSDPFTGRIYSLKFWRNGVLVRDFIPVRVGTVGYLYDRVSKRLFGNAGTGDFVLGPDVVPVEYLQGVLGGYVDTGIKSLNTISADISFGVVNPTHDSTSGLGILLYGNGTTWAFNSYAIFFQNTLNQPDYKSLSFHGHNNILVQTPQNSFDCNVGVSCDGTSTATVTTTYNRTTTSRSISISAIDGTKNFTLLWNRLLDDNTVITRLKSAEFISGGATIAKFVPVRVGTEGAMMDVLTRRIYRNQGTGAFTWGGDLKYPIPAE